jgi:HSP20 family protein
MAKSIRAVKKEENRPTSLDRVFEGFSKELESMMRPWPELWSFPQIEGMRVPLCDMKDSADRYELHVEVPGIDKEKIDVRATGDMVEISGEQSEKSEEKRKDYVYNERSRKSFYRKIRMPEEIDPSRVSASMKNGVLVVELPKTGKSKKSGATKVEIK